MCLTLTHVPAGRPIPKGVKMVSREYKAFKLKPKKGQKLFKFWKAYAIDYGVIYTPYLHRQLRINNGIVKSDRKSVNLTKIEYEFSEVNKGIHVYTHAKSINLCYIRIPVYAKPEDIVGYCYYSSDRSEVVCTKVYINPEDVKKALKDTFESAIFWVDGKKVKCDFLQFTGTLRKG